MKSKRGCVISLWHALLFFSSDDTEFIRRFLAEAITHGFSRRRPVRSLQIPLESGICPTDFTDFLFFWNFYSSDDTEFIRRFLATAITHGFTRRRPVRSLQIPPESGICPTDFTDLHRFTQIISASISFPYFHFSFVICLSFLIYSSFSFTRLSHLSFVISH